MLVHLSEWEWACCGDAFIAGDEVELQVVAPGLDDRPPKPYTVTLTPVPGAVRTVPVTRVPTTAPDPAAEEKTRLVHEADEPPSGPVELFSGYLVELDPV